MTEGKQLSPTPVTPATGAAVVAERFRSYTPPAWRQPTPEMIAEARDNAEYVTTAPSTCVAYVSIGNSDDELTQHEWSNFIRELKNVLSDFSGRTYGEWFSASDSTWQNMCVCKELERDDLDRLRAALRALRRFYRQDSVALVIVDQTEFV